MDTKKDLVIYVLKILEANTDRQSPMTQTEMTKWINAGGHRCDRKTVCRNIKFLTEAGFPIVKTSKGFYMDKRLFSLREARFVLEAVLSAKDEEEIDKQSLCERLHPILSKLRMD